MIHLDKIFSFFRFCDLDLWRFNNQKIKIRGKIDRIDKINNTIRIIDYKTGKKIYAKDLRLKNKEQLFEEKGIYNLQLVVYAIAIYDEFKKRDLKTGIISLKNRKIIYFVVKNSVSIFSGKMRSSF